MTRLAPMAMLLWSVAAAPASATPAAGGLGADFTLDNLHARRYLAHAMSNQEPERRDVTFPANHFTTANVQKLAAH